MNKISNSILKLKIAPKLDHNKNFAFTGKDWIASEYPTHGEHGNNWTEDDWQTAIDIFEDRLRGRYFNYIEVLLNFEYSIKDYHAGFAITALDCLIIETLQQFYEGRDSSQGSEKSFERFLTTTSFQKNFGVDTSEGSLADLFYDQIRCGILHQAEVKTDSRIVSTGAELIAEEGKGVIVNRRKFHAQLLREFEDYVKRLRKPKTKEDLRLRKNFRQKMDYICKVRTPPDPKVKTVLYFAYGSNMKSSQIKSKKRAPSAKAIGRAKLTGKRLVFNKVSKNGSGKANLVDDPKAETWGVLYEIEKKDLDTLDKSEAGYQRTQVTVTTDDGKTRTVQTYISLGPDDKLKPYDSYKTMLIEGANEFKLPQNYIDELSNVTSLPDPKSGLT